MRITIKTDPYNPRRHSKPWIARVTSWDSGKPGVSFGDWHGSPGDSGMLEIEAEPGDIVRRGQKDMRKPSSSDNDWYIVEADGRLTETSEVEARELWVARQTSPPESPLAQVSDEDLLAEVRRRGLAL